MHLSKETRDTQRILMLVLFLVVASVVATQIWLLIASTSTTLTEDIIEDVSVVQPHLASILVASADASTRQVPNLLGIRIDPQGDGDHVITTSQTIRFTSVGIFSTMEKQIAATWSLLRGTNEQEIDKCRFTKTCDFTAGSNPEHLSIFARTSGLQDRINVEVISPAANLFTDTIPSWANTAIVRLRNLGIVRGYEDGRYGSADSLSRGQVITLLARTLEQSQIAQMPSSCGAIQRVAADHYAYRPLCLFMQNAWENNVDFNPDEQLSRGETAAYINRVFGSAMLNAMRTSQGAILAEGQIFSDVPVSHWHFFDAGVTNVTGIMTGNPDGTFGVDRTLNRAEAATVVDRLLESMSRLNIRDL